MRTCVLGNQVLRRPEVFPISIVFSIDYGTMVLSVDFVVISMFRTFVIFEMLRGCRFWALCRFTSSIIATMSGHKFAFCSMIIFDTLPLG